jgi:hypothetical protein
LLRCAERGLTLTEDQRRVIAAAIELYKPFLLEPEEIHSNEPEIEPGNESQESHSEEPAPDSVFYSVLERERRLAEIYRSLEH